jgi:hypothetical protein
LDIWKLILFLFLPVGNVHLSLFCYYLLTFFLEEDFIARTSPELAPAKATLFRPGQALSLPKMWIGKLIHIDGKPLVPGANMPSL